MGEWQSTTLGALSDIGGGSIQTGPFGSQLHASAYVDEGVPIVMPLNIGDNRIDESTTLAQASFEDAKRLERHRLEAGDIVYSRRGDVERRALVRPEQEGWLCGTGCLRVRLGDPQLVDSTFVSYLLGAPWVREWIVQHAVGATMLNLNTKILSSVPLIVPAVEEQRAIAEVLGALDDKIAGNLRVAKTADHLAQAEFLMASRSSTMSDKRFDDLATVGGGGTPSSKVASYWNGSVAWATPTDVTALQGPYIAETSRTITEAGLAACSSPLYPVGSILMTSRATIGAFAIAEIPIAVNQGFIVVVPNDEGQRYWLFHEMRTRINEFTAFANGATFLELSRRNFRQFKVRLAEERVMREFEAIASGLHDRASAALQENASLAATRDALLPALMSGKLRVKDAERQVEAVV